MNYYPFHVGDYAAHTAHLEPMEDLAYRRMLDVYYLREGALPADVADVARLIRMRSNLAEVDAVLSEFFVMTPDGWRHARCDAELERMQDKQAKARDAAKSSVRARQAASAQRAINERSTDAQRTLSVRSTDVELPTPTPIPTPKEPEQKTARLRALPPERPDDVPEVTWTDWLTLRRTKRAPVTQTVLAEARAQAVKAGMTMARFLEVWCARGSQGLEADWLKPHERGPPVKPPIAQVFAEKSYEVPDDLKPKFQRQPSQPVDPD